MTLLAEQRRGLVHPARRGAGDDILGTSSGRDQFLSPCLGREEVQAPEVAQGRAHRASQRRRGREAGTERDRRVDDEVQTSAAPCEDRASAIPFDLPSHDLALLVVDTKAEHALVDGQYAARRASCERAAGELGVASLRDLDPRSLQIDLAKLSDPIDRARVRHVVTEIERVHESVMALEQDDFVSVGRLFDESHASLRDDYEVSCAELDVAVDAMVSAGALGARMTGGGFGGSCIGLVPVGDLEAAVDAVHTAYADRGWPPAEVFTATAAGPAARDA